MPVTLPYGITLTAEAALSASTGSYGAWDAGLWNTATWGPDELWTDISRYVESLSTSRRFGREVTTWESGTATLNLRNEDGRFSPDNLSGPYVTAGVTGIRPLRPARVAATYGGVTYPVYRGYTTAWEETWIEPSPGAGGALVTVPCIDEMGRLAGYDGFEQPPIGAGESTGQRINRILNNAGHTGARSVDLGRMTVQATTLAQNAVSDLKLTADSEGGAVWVDADGTLIFDDYPSAVEGRSATVQATWGDTAGDLPYSAIKTEYNGDLTQNLAAFARDGGTQQLVGDSTSRALYGDRQYRRNDLICETDSQVQTLAALQVAVRGNPERRVTQIEVRPLGNPARLWPVVLGTRVRDLWRVKRTPPGGYSISQLVFVAGISHVVTADNWVTTFDLNSATPFAAFASSRFDVGKWDSVVWYF